MSYTIETLRELREALSRYPLEEECRTIEMNIAIDVAYGIIGSNWNPEVIRNEIEKEAIYRQSLRDNRTINCPLYDLFYILFVCKTEDLPLMIDSEFRWLIEWRLRTTQEYTSPEKSA